MDKMWTMLTLKWCLQTKLSQTKGVKVTFSLFVAINKMSKFQSVK